jgi:hypothetical protein
VPTDTCTYVAAVPGLILERDAWLESSDDLQHLVRRCRELMEPPGSDVVISRDGRVVALLRASGETHYFVED